MPLDKGGVLGFNQQVVVIDHQAISVAIPIVAIDRILQQHQKLLTINIITVDLFPSIATGYYMIQRPCKFNA